MTLAEPSPVRSSPPDRKRPFVRVRAFLRHHPILCLLLLTPGIPEYLSGSSALNGLFEYPFVFLLFLAANLGLYGPGVLLIRETVVRRRLRWPSLLAFGAAYAIVEEGLALSTIFNPNASVVGALGTYGHFGGVSWVWVLGLLMVHTVFSISLPIVLLGLALPETRGRSLLSTGQMIVAGALLISDVLLLALLVRFGEHFWMGDAVFAGALGAVATLVVVGLRLGTPSLPHPGRPPSWQPSTFLALGVVLFPGSVVIEGLFEYWRIPAAIAILVVGGYFLAWLWALLTHLGSVGNERALAALAGGLIAPLMVFGIAAGLPTPIVLVPDALAILLLRKLWRNYPPSAPGIPAGALGRSVTG